MKEIILHNIRSAYNVGAIFRTADAVGVKTIYLSGYTPCPIDRFGRPCKEINKTSLGASETVSWQSVDDIQKLIIQLQQAGVTVVAVEQVNGAISVADFVVPEQVAYILGNEVSGVPEDITNIVDAVVAIPMFGQKESLNVSVAAGIIMYHGLV